MIERLHTGTAGTSQLSNTLVGVFATEHDARAAIGALHKAGFRKTWLGKIFPADAYTGEPLVEEPGSQFARFISGERAKRSLTGALLAQGTSEEQASAVEGDVAPGCAVVTVYGEDNPARVEALLSEHKGSVFGSASAQPTAVEAAAAAPRVGVDKGDTQRSFASDDSATAAPFANDAGGREHAVEEFYARRPSTL